MVDIARSYRFPKREKVCNVKDISALFKGESLFVYPFKVGYLTKNSCTGYINIKVLTSVGKRYSKSAVKRNLIKRRVREAYRLNKHIVTESVSDISLSLAFIYIAHKEESYEQIEKSIIKSLYKIKELLEKSPNCDSTITDKLL